MRMLKAPGACGVALDAEADARFALLARPHRLAMKARDSFASSSSSPPIPPPPPHAPHPRLAAKALSFSFAGHRACEAAFAGRGRGAHVDALAAQFGARVGAEDALATLFDDNARVLADPNLASERLVRRVLAAVLVTGGVGGVAAARAQTLLEELARGGGDIRRA